MNIELTEINRVSRDLGALDYGDIFYFRTHSNPKKYYMKCLGEEKDSLRGSILKYVNIQNGNIYFGNSGDIVVKVNAKVLIEDK